MRGAFTSLLCGAASVAALNINRNAPQLFPEVKPSAVPDVAPNSVIPIFVTRTWPLLSPEQALTSLHAVASQTPSAVSLLPGITIPTDLVNKVEQAVEEVKDSFLEEKIENPTKIKAAKAGSKIEEDAATATQAECANPAVRYEWRNLSDQHKSQYVNAIKCLYGKPSKSGLPGAKTRWDDLVAVHQHMNPIIHNVGQFLPWHRYYLHIFQSLLSTECGYTGPLPWWDETKDAGNFNGAPPFTSQYEGHMPVGNTVCIISGVFANTQLNIGPGSSNTQHCLSRGVDESLSADITSNFVNTCNSYTNYNDMQNCQFYGPHAYGHDAVGGVMSDVQSSPGDPAFFLHHAFVDRNWRIWERTNPSARTYQIGGYTTQNCGNSCQPTTLNYVLSSMGLAPEVTIDQVMDTQGDYLCYHYDY